MRTTVHVGFGSVGLASIVLAGALAVAATLAGSGRAAAECEGAFPLFRELVATARTIVIGDVVGVERGGALDPVEDGVSSRFTLQVLHVLRGTSGAVVKIDDLPTQPCSPVVGARAGDRIALALDGVAFDPPVRSNMVAWIDAVPPPLFGPGNLSQAETVSVAEVFALAGRDMPPSEAFGPPPTPEAPADAALPPALLAVFLASMVIVAAATATLLRRSRS